MHVQTTALRKHALTMGTGHNQKTHRKVYILSHGGLKDRTIDTMLLIVLTNLNASDPLRVKSQNTWHRASQAQK